MKLSESVKPISYLKTHASELIRNISTNQKTLVITLNGEAKVVIQDIASYEQMQESIALLKILAQGEKSKRNGNSKTAQKTFSDLKKELKVWNAIQCDSLSGSRR